MTDPTPHQRRSPVEHEHNTCPLGDDCDLTLAYMVGFHKRDDEVSALRAERDALRAAIIKTKDAADAWAISRATGHQGLEGEKADKLWKALRNMRAVADGPIAASASIVQEVEGRDG